MQGTKRVAVNTGFLYARMGVTIFISLYATRVILTTLGANDFGLFNIVGGVIAMLGFLNASMAAATQRFLSHAQGSGNFGRLKQIFNVSVVLHLIVAALVLIVLQIAGYFFFNGILNIASDRLYAAKLVYQFMLLSTLFTVISVPYDAVINARENMLHLAIFGIIEAILKLAIALYLTHTSGDKLVVYGLLTAILSVLLLVSRRIYCNRKYAECKIDVRKYFSKPIFKEMGSFAGWSFLGSSASMLSYYGQGVLINMFFGTIVNAAQGIANQVSGQLNAFSVTMLNALNPTIAKSEGAGDRSLMLKASLMGSKLSFFLLIFFYIPVLIEMPFIFKFWLKDVPDYAVIFCRLLLVNNLTRQLFIPLNTSILAVGNIRRYQIYFSILTIFPLPVSCLLFRHGFPAYSLYFVFIVYSIINAGFILFSARKNIGLSILHFVKKVVFNCAIIFLIIIAISFIPVLIMPNGTIRLCCVAGISSVLFLLLVWFLGFSTEERIGFMKMVSSTSKNFRLGNKIFKQRFGWI